MNPEMSNGMQTYEGCIFLNAVYLRSAKCKVFTPANGISCKTKTNMRQNSCNKDTIYNVDIREKQGSATNITTWV